MKEAGGGNIERRQRTRRLGATAIGVAVSLAIAGGFLATASANDDGDWACDSSQVARSVGELAGSGGSQTRDEAYSEEVTYLISDGFGDESWIAAVASDSGPTRLDRDSGKLWVDDLLVADMDAVQFDDGTWVVGSDSFCTPRIPDLESPGETPSSTPTDEVPVESDTPTP